MRFGWVTALAVAVALVCASTGVAFGQEKAEGQDEYQGESSGDVVLDDPPKVEPWSPRLDRGRPFSVGVDAYGGLALLWTSGPEDRARAIGGGLLRFSYWYLQAGLIAELTNTGEASALFRPKQEKWVALGGFVGTMLPFEKWIDLETTLGLVNRTYSNPSSIYGAGGFSESGQSIVWRAGISARTARRLTGARLGAGFFGAFDLQTHDPTWTRTYTTADGLVHSVSGTTPVGGVTFGLYMSGGFEISDWKRKLLE